MKLTEPKIESRDEQHYVGIRKQVPMAKLPETVPQVLDEVFGWLNDKGIEPDGPPIIRYHVINMDDKLDVEFGVLVASAVSGDDRVVGGIIPAGRYAHLIYTDVTQGIEGNGALIRWVEEQGIEWDAWDTPTGHAFRSRIEYLLDGPEDDPDQTKWRTEVAIKVAD